MKKITDSDDELLGTAVTLNCYGRTSDVPNEYSQAFIEYARQTKGFVLDIGAAFGVASIPALIQGATVTANDISANHLAVLLEKAPVHLHEYLELVPGRFPSELSFDDGVFDAVHASNLLNFLRGDEIVCGLGKIKRWLKPNGKVFINCGTPYAANVKDFIPIYEGRKRKGIRWPGEVENVHLYSSHQTISELPGFLHLLDADVLCETFESVGFSVDVAEMYLRSGLPGYLRYDGRENVGLIASILRPGSKTGTPK